MNKLKKQKNINLLNYEHFLKNNSLKKKKIKLNHMIFENPILFKHQDLNIIEFNDYKNIAIPLTVLDFNSINTIETSYKNQLLFSYNLNYKILDTFWKMMFNNTRKYDNDITEGRILKSDNNKVLLSILGNIFFIKSKNLHNIINRVLIDSKSKKKRFNKFNRRNILKIKKNAKIRKLIKKYQFKIIKLKINNNIYKKSLSHHAIITYFTKINIIGINNERKRNLSRKLYEKKHKKK